MGDRRAADWRARLARTEKTQEIAARNRLGDELADDLMIHSRIVSAQCEKLFPGQKWLREQVLFVDALVQDWDDDQYATAVWAVIDDLRRRGIRVEGLDYKLMPLPL